MNMTTSLPRFIDPLRLAKTKTHLQGKLLISDLTRLKELLTDPAGVVAVELDFGTDHNGYHYIQGRIQTNLGLTCQRCLEHMDFVINLHIALSPVATEQAARLLPEAYEELLLGEEGTVEIIDLVEEELLLALPLAPRHEKCPEKV